MHNLIEKLRRNGDFFTAGFLAEEDGILGAYVEQLRRAPLPVYENMHLYPLSAALYRTGVLEYDYSYSLRINWAQLNGYSPEEQQIILRKYRTLHHGGSCIEDRFALGGRGYTHYNPELAAFMNESLPSYLQAYRREGELFAKLQPLCDAVIAYVERIVCYLSEFTSERAKRLVGAYTRFLSGKAESFFDAFIRVAFVLSLDGYDSLGGVDGVLAPFTPCEESGEMFAELYAAYEKNNAWNFVLGNDEKTTALALRSFAGASRPNFSVKVDENTSDDVFEACLEMMKRGARPAFYSKRNYESELFRLGIEKEDLHLIGYGGCTETMIAGKSNVGSLEAGINFAQTLCEILYQKQYSSYEELFSAYKARIEGDLREIVRQVNDEMVCMQNRPQYMRTLLCPPCAESGKEFNGGGAKYYASIINFCALANAVDSLYAIKKLVYDGGRFTYAQMLTAIKSNFEEGKDYLSAVRELTMFGNENAEVDSIARDIFSLACDELALHKTAIGNGPFIAGCIMFNTALSTGKMTDCTPDGRFAYAPVADSGGAFAGRDRVSPTALLNSISAINPMRAVGSWVVNLLLSESVLAGKNGAIALKALLLGYFERGGNQVQINLVDREKLIAAIDDDELAKSIIVRVGGFSERFSNLSREFRRDIAKRTEY